MKYKILRLIIIELMIISVLPLVNTAITNSNTQPTTNQVLSTLHKNEGLNSNNNSLQAVEKMDHNLNIQKNNYRNTAQQVNSIITHELPFGATADQFITKWNAWDRTISLPLTTSGTYNFVVDWGDGKSNTITSFNDTSKSHTYVSPSVYNVTITGILNGWAFVNNQNSAKFVDIIQWGNMQLGNDGAYFKGANNMQIFAIDVPDLSSTTNMSYMFYGADKFNQPLDNWDVSSVTDMSGMFSGADEFNQSLDNWDTSAVTNMSYMYYFAVKFNQPLDSWDVSSVTDMSGMFYGARNFNQSLDSWNVFSVTDMSHMFFAAPQFNQPLDSWNVFSVTDMSHMFDRTYQFNQPLDSWNVSSVTDMSHMFDRTLLNQPLNNWDVSAVRDMSHMFDSTLLNQPLNNWDVSSVTDMSYMFFQASDFNQPLNTWNTSSVTDMSFMFSAISVAQSLLHTSFVPNHSYVYGSEGKFNQPLDNWDVSSVTDMSYMFFGARNFNQPLDNWDVSSVTDMSGMFYGARNFNQPLDIWNVSSVTDMSDMFYFNQISTDNYDSLLISWSILSLQSDVTFYTGRSQYSSKAAAARNVLTNTYHWNIIDRGLAVPTDLTTLDMPFPLLSAFSTMIIISLILRKKYTTGI